MSQKRVAGRFVRVRQPWTPGAWDDGYIDNRGRFRVYRPDCPRAYSNGYALRAHVVWWLHHGVCHPADSELHHDNDNRLDDRLSNLVPLANAEHQKTHKARPVRLVCERCGAAFVRPAWKVRSSTPRFCGQGCYHAHPRDDEHRASISRGMTAKHARRSAGQ